MYTIYAVSASHQMFLLNTIAIPEDILIKVGIEVSYPNLERSIFENHVANDIYSNEIFVAGTKKLCLLKSTDSSFGPTM